MGKVAKYEFVIAPRGLAGNELGHGQVQSLQHEECGKGDEEGVDLRTHDKQPSPS